MTDRLPSLWIGIAIGHLKELSVLVATVLP